MVGRKGVTAPGRGRNSGGRGHERNSNGLGQNQAVQRPSCSACAVSRYPGPFMAAASTPATQCGLGASITALLGVVTTLSRACLKRGVPNDAEGAEFKQLQTQL